ncbi:MAG TPA: branched-chain amino acid ABC transporter permease [Stellaceae bacterium]|nr:branched-chain amino acid ABC transporter permease [Stellaceae bacterium]
MKGIHISVLLAASALALYFADGLSSYWMHVAIIAMYYGILAASWSLLAGYVGLFSLSHMAFASIGAYTSQLLINWSGIPIPLSMLAGIVMCCAVGGLVGWVCLRMSGPYLAIFTLGFSEIVRIAIATEDQVTAGMAGLHTDPLFPDAATRLPYFYTAFALLAVSLLLMGFLVRSRWGLFLRAIREDEQAAAASGVAVARFRILAFAIASGFAGLAGGFYAHYIPIITPSMGDLDEMAKLVVMTVIGGMELLPTAVGGAFFVEFLLEKLRDLADGGGSIHWQIPALGLDIELHNFDQWRLPIFGIILLLTMRFARNGLVTPFWLLFMRLGEARAIDRPAVRDLPQKDSGT